MPYKDQKKHQEWVERYKKPYMREYVKQRRQQDRKLREAVRRGDLDLAKQIMGKKPSINPFSQIRQDVFGKKKGKKQ